MEEFFGQNDIIDSIIIVLILIFIIGPVLREKISPKQTPEDAGPIEAPKPEPLLIHCPACGAEVSRYAPACLKCGHPICPTGHHKSDINSTEQTIIIQQEARQSNGMGTAGFVLSLIALVLSWVPGIGWFVWFLGFLLSFFGMFKSPRGLAVIGFLISIISFIILVAVVGALAGAASLFF